jgi:predicted SprT family Zn-dependent metalloprotease
MAVCLNKGFNWRQNIMNNATQENSKNVLYNTEHQPTKNNPTEEIYTELKKAYDFFNQHLFENKLPPCLITLQRKARAYGYFSANRFQHVEAGTLTDEISMNPDHFKTEPLRKVLSTLVHEMVHLQQAYIGKPSRTGYHNREWANLMLAAGLIPSSTGGVGGAQVGQHMTHYIEPAGRFDKVCQELIDGGFRLSWADKFGNNKMKSKPTRIKYTCEDCGLNAWAKPNIQLLCGECQKSLLAEDL